MPASCRHDAILEASWSHLEGNLAELGAKKGRLSLGLTECAEPFFGPKTANTADYALRGLTQRAAQGRRRIQSLRAFRQAFPQYRSK